MKKKQQQQRRLTTVGRTLCCYKTSNLPHQTVFDQYTPELSKTLSKGRASDESIIFWSRILRLVCCSGSCFEKDRLSAVSLRGRRSKEKGKGIRARDRARGRREEGGGELFSLARPTRSRA